MGGLFSDSCQSSILQVGITASHIFNCIKCFSLCVICCACSHTCAQVFQESPGVLLTPQLVPPLQDCCAFWLVPVCTTEEGASRRRVSAAHITFTYCNYQRTPNGVNAKELTETLLLTLSGNGLISAFSKRTALTSFLGWRRRRAEVTFRSLQYTSARSDGLVAPSVQCNPSS